MTVLELIKEAIKAIGDSLNDDLSGYSYNDLKDDSVYGDRTVRAQGVINRGLQRAYQLNAYNALTAKLGNAVEEKGVYTYTLEGIARFGKVIAVIGGGRAVKFDAIGDILMTTQAADKIVYAPRAPYLTSTIDTDADLNELGIDEHIAVALPLYLKYELGQDDAPELAAKALGDYDAAITGQMQPQSLNLIESSIYKKDMINRALLAAGETVVIDKDIEELNELLKNDVNPQLIALIPLYSKYESELLEGKPTANALLNEYMSSAKKLQKIESNLYKKDMINRALLAAGENLVIDKDIAELNELLDEGVHPQLIALIPLYSKYESELLEGKPTANALLNEYMASAKKLQKIEKTIYKKDMINRALLAAGETVVIDKDIEELNELLNNDVNLQLIALIPLYSKYESELLENKGSAISYLQEFNNGVAKIERQCQSVVQAVYRIPTDY